MYADLIFKHYERFLRSSNTCKSERAIEDYLLSIDMFQRESGEKFLETVKIYRDFHWHMEALGERTEWPDGRSKKRWGARTMYKTATEIIVFFRWALAFNFTPHKIALDTPEVGHLFQKAVEKEPEFFDWNDPELLKLLHDPNNSTRKKAIYHTLRASGVRPSECGNLHKADFSLDDNILTIRRRKGGKSGFAPLDKVAVEKLREYFHDLAWHYNGPWAFLKEDYSGPVTAHGIWKMMYNHGKKLGIHFYPYRLRHSAPGEWAAMGHDTLAISDAMGHVDPRTTKIYFHVSKQKMKSFYQPKDGYEKNILTLPDKMSMI